MCFPKPPSTSREVFHWKDPSRETWYLVRAMLFQKKLPWTWQASSWQMYSHACVTFATKAPSKETKGIQKPKSFWLKAKILFSSNNYGTVKEKKLGIPPVYNHAMSFTKKDSSHFLLNGKSWDISAENLGIWPGPLKPWAWRRDSKCTARCHCPRFWQALKNARAVDVGWLPFFVVMCFQAIHPGRLTWFTYKSPI